MTAPPRHLQSLAKAEAATRGLALRRDGARRKSMALGTGWRQARADADEADLTPQKIASNQALITAAGQVEVNVEQDGSEVLVVQAVGWQAMPGFRERTAT
jgi:hypothetical protein